MRHFEHYINGQFSAGKRQFESINPATNTPWALMPMSTSDDVDLAVQSAKRAFSAPAWANMTASERGALLLRLAEQIAEHADELADWKPSTRVKSSARRAVKLPMSPITIAITPD